MKTITKIILPGIYIWLIPFAVSFLFYKPGGELGIPYDLFKSIMIVVGALSGCYFLFRHFRTLDSDFVKQGITIGVSWFFINIVLDVLILIPIMKVSFPEYFMSIGLRYLMIPVFSFTIGYLLSNKIKQ